MSMDEKNTPEPESKKPAKVKKTIGGEARELWDTIVLAFVLVTLMKTFVLDLYKIPSGSMTPTLIGDAVQMRDVNRDDIDDLVIFRHVSTIRGARGDSLGRDWMGAQVFLGQPDGTLRCDSEALRNTLLQGIRATTNEIDLRYDRILVNKLWYWLFPLERGDILVFKLPEQVFRPDTPFYIKRVAGLGGETPAIDAQGHILIDGELVTEPEFMANNYYFLSGRHPQTGIEGQLPFANAPGQANPFVVPENHFIVWGDNSGNSEDSRYWGSVPADHVRGRAFFRYWPPQHMSFLQ